jgi:hypothetical protein
MLRWADDCDFDVPKDFSTLGLQCCWSTLELAGLSPA